MQVFSHKHAALVTLLGRSQTEYNCELKLVSLMQFMDRVPITNINLHSTLCSLIFFVLPLSNGPLRIQMFYRTEKQQALLTLMIQGLKDKPVCGTGSFNT